MSGRSEDRELADLRRSLEADPDDDERRLRLEARLGRLFGDRAEVLLRDHELWAHASESLREAAVSAVARRLRPDYRLTGRESFQCGGRSYDIGVFRHVRTGLILHLVPGGQGLMGSPPEPAAGVVDRGSDDERPRHEVHLAPFLIGERPVSQAIWHAHPPPPRSASSRSTLRLARDWLLGEDEPEPPEQPKIYFEGPALPVHGLSWRLAARWVSGLGDGLRLPTETEWEYACRSGTVTTFFWGESMDPERCLFGASSGQRVHGAGDDAMRRNAFGLVDMAGHVLEPCADDWRVDYRSGPRDGRPFRDSGSLFGTVRGGSWRHSAEACRSADRRPVERTLVDFSIGLRVAASVPGIPVESPDEGASG